MYFYVTVLMRLLGCLLLIKIYRMTNWLHAVGTSSPVGAGAGKISYPGGMSSSVGSGALVSGAVHQWT